MSAEFPGQLVLSTRFLSLRFEYPQNDKQCHSMEICLGLPRRRAPNILYGCEALQVLLSNMSRWHGMEGLGWIRKNAWTIIWLAAGLIGTVYFLQERIVEVFPLSSAVGACQGNLCQTFSGTAYDAARSALLQYYTGESLAHAGLLLTVVLALFAAKQAGLGGALFSLVFGFSVTTAIFILGRLLVWSSMADVVIRAQAVPDQTPFAALHDPTLNAMVKGYGGLASFFSHSPALTLLEFLSFLGLTLSGLYYVALKWKITRRSSS